MVDLASDLGGFLPGGEPKYLTPGAALHICGTTRAGKVDDRCSVVDRHSKAWRVEDLFVGGCGVIPTQNACNPTLTAACFAVMGARKIIEEMDELKANRAIYRTHLWLLSFGYFSLIRAKNERQVASSPT